MLRSPDTTNLRGDKMTTQLLFTFEATGCHADGALGHQHCRDALAGLLRDVFPTEHALFISLGGNMPDDAWDEEEALELLNLTSVTAEGLSWGFRYGDFGLWSAEEETG